MDLNEKIGKRIIELRNERNMTMEKLAYESEISKGGLSEIERGLKEARLSTLLKVCQVLEVSIQDFFDFDI
jgi:transcriptional regulator with XRE-family HTH domain